LKSVQYQREELLRENWRAMRDVEWEQFLTRAFRLLGATVETTRVTGDQGADLVVEKGPIRQAIQAKGYHNSVGNGAVQAAVAGMAHYHCNACAVITNSWFTVSAEELAMSNRCKLIGEEQIPALVLGKLAIWESRWRAIDGIAILAGHATLLVCIKKLLSFFRNFMLPRERSGRLPCVNRI
jgi:hypothetical protein